MGKLRFPVFARRLERRIMRIHCAIAPQFNHYRAVNGIPVTFEWVTPQVCATTGSDFPNTTKLILTKLAAVFEYNNNLLLAESNAIKSIS